MTETLVDRWAKLLVVAAAVCGLLAMHGFEAALVHADHAHAAGHVAAGVEASAAEIHVQQGTCSLEKPDSPVGPTSPCPVDALAPAVPLGLQGTTSKVATLANRAVLTAFSILRL